MTRASLTIAALLVIAVLAAGCGARQHDQASTGPPAQRTATTPDSPAPAIYGDPYLDGRYPARLGRSATRFFTSYLTYLYGHGGSIDRATSRLRRRLRADGPVRDLSHLTPRVVRLMIADQYPDHATVIAVIDDGRRDGTQPELSARFRRLHDRWLAVSVGAGERG